jgi:hypothetical protein
MAYQPRFCGMVFSERLQKKIKAFAKPGESCEDCKARIEAAHRVDKSTKDMENMSEDTQVKGSVDDEVDT